MFDKFVFKIDFQINSCFLNIWNNFSNEYYSEMISFVWKIIFGKSVSSMQTSLGLEIDHVMAKKKLKKKDNFRVSPTYFSTEFCTNFQRWSGSEHRNELKYMSVKELPINFNETIIVHLWFGLILFHPGKLLF